MKDSKLKTFLETATNVAVLFLALLILGNFAWTHLAGRPQPGLVAGLRKGDTFSLIPGVDYSNYRLTLIIAMSTGCEQCNESIPFVKQLLQINLEYGNKTRIVAVFPETAEQVTGYVSERQINLEARPGINPKALNLPGTPTAVLINNEGKILNFWIGKPSKDAENEMLDIIRRVA